MPLFCWSNIRVTLQQLYFKNKGGVIYWVGCTLSPTWPRSMNLCHRGWSGPVQNMFLLMISPFFASPRLCQPTPHITKWHQPVFEYLRRTKYAWSYFRLSLTGWHGKGAIVLLVVVKQVREVFFLCCLISFPFPESSHHGSNLRKIRHGNIFSLPSTISQPQRESNSNFRRRLLKLNRSWHSEFWHPKISFVL